MLPQIKHIADTGPHYFGKYKVESIIFFLQTNPTQPKIHIEIMIKPKSI